MNEITIDPAKLTRLVVYHEGQENPSRMEVWQVDVELLVQDGGLTLKIFTKYNPAKPGSEPGWFKAVPPLVTGPCLRCSRADWEWRTAKYCSLCVTREEIEALTIKKGPTSTKGDGA